ncbi:hypothetical protein [Pedobacter punctiformis]|uniref:Uncharacterized protein n=1 Tax=Pedobacter punctiformis TaxID=3004097 RepID=A0ABT4LAJ5_9SPHI|nr:hypothetical protein [Pedobacter sp. HCMS5-2]MCZ4244924.1 hypothetical protein [Pedobacter sp. HCMS5-2]
MESAPVVQAIQGKGLVQFMREIELPGEENAVPFPVEKTAYLRNQASSTMKYEFPDRVYSVSNRGDKTLVYWERRESCR